MANTISLLVVSNVVNLNLNFVLFEGDAKVVIDALSSNYSWEVATIFAALLLCGQNDFAHSIAL